MTFDALKTQLTASSRIWCVTGAAGFIGCNLVEALLELDQSVIGLDNFSTGQRRAFRTSPITGRCTVIFVPAT